MLNIVWKEVGGRLTHVDVCVRCLLCFPLVLCCPYRAWGCESRDARLKHEPSPASTIHEVAGPLRGVYRRREGVHSSHLEIGALKYELTGRHRAAGSVVSSAHNLHLAPADDPVAGQPVENKKLGLDLWVVYWGRRVYLIEPAKMLFFCNAVNSGDEPSEPGEGSFYCKIEPGRVDATGTPRGPIDLAPFLLPHPICGAIENSDRNITDNYVPGLRRRFPGYRATLAVGTRCGAFDGMRLHMVAKSSPVDVYIVEAGCTKSTVVIVPFAVDDSDDDVGFDGMCVSSRRDSLNTSRKGVK